MKKELQDALYKKYPKLFVRRNKPITESLMPFGLECGEGWYTLIDTLCYLIQAHVDWKQRTDKDYYQVEFAQIKEKFGSIRIYSSGHDDFIDGAIELVELMSSITCEYCGSTENVTRTKGWIVTLCSKCMKKYINKGVE